MSETKQTSSRRGGAPPSSETGRKLRWGRPGGFGSGLFMFLVGIGVGVCAWYGIDHLVTVASGHAHDSNSFRLLVGLIAAIGVGAALLTTWSMAACLGAAIAFAAGLALGLFQVHLGFLGSHQEIYLRGAIDPATPALLGFWVACILTRLFPRRV